MRAGCVAMRCVHYAYMHAYVCLHICIYMHAHIRYTCRRVYNMPLTSAAASLAWSAPPVISSSKGISCSRTLLRVYSGAQLLTSSRHSWRGVQDGGAGSARGGGGGEHEVCAGGRGDSGAEGDWNCTCNAAIEGGLGREDGEVEGGARVGGGWGRGGEGLASALEQPEQFSLAHAQQRSHPWPGARSHAAHVAQVDAPQTLEQDSLRLRGG